MKIMATSCPSDEHLFPMLPTLWALRNAGHDVLVALPARFAKMTAATGLPTTAVADDIDFSARKLSSRAATVTDLAEHIIDYYVPFTELTVNHTVALAEAWRPDLVLCSDWEYAGPIAAAIAGVPTVLHGRGMLGHPAISAQVANAMRPMHRHWGLTDDAPAHWKIIDPCPPSLQWTTPPTNAIAARYVGFHRPGMLPSWIFEQPEAPRVLVTLGNDPRIPDRTSLLHSVLRALLPLDIEVIIATSEHLGVDRLVEVPRRTRLTHGVPLSHLVPTCAAVINDGSASNVMAAAVAGVPQLGLPQVSGQFQHAERIAEVGAGLSLQPEQASVDTITEATRTLLNELGQRAIARRIQVENDGRPRLDEVVAVLEQQFTGQHRPGFSGSGGRLGHGSSPRPPAWLPSPEVPTTRVPSSGNQRYAPTPELGRHAMERVVTTRMDPTPADHLPRQHGTVA